MLSLGVGRWVRVVAGVVAVVTLGAGCGQAGDAGGAGASTTLPPFPSTLPTTPKLLTAGEAERAAPRWEEMSRFGGDGPYQTPVFTVEPAVIQWRVKYECETGTFRVDTMPGPSKRGPLVETSCPAQGEGFSVQTGDMRLGVQATGPWRMTLEQQVETPLAEPPLPGMESAPVIARGTFYDIEKNGSGTAEIYRLPDGRRVLRFSEDFRVFNNTDLVVWLSEVPEPRTSAEASENPYVEIAPLKSTRGAQNYLIPDDLPDERIRSVVLWCVPVPTAYTAAALTR